jgi:UrcA family protein
MENHMSRFIKSTALVAAFAFAAPLFTTQTAAAREPARSITVSYGDLNLTSSEGVDTLFGRIERASRKVCGGRPDHIMNGVLTRYLACRDAVAGETVRRIDVPGLSLAWAQKHGEAIQTASR